jgi:hypothetical protein
MPALNAGMALLGLLSALAQDPEAAPAPTPTPVDPRIEKAFYPLFQVQMQIDQAVRGTEPLRAAFKALGKQQACPVYLDAWRAAYVQQFGAVRAAYYDAVRKHVPDSALSKKNLKFLDDSILDQYGSAVRSELHDGPGLAATKALGVAMLTNLVSLATVQSAAVPATDSEVDALLAKPGVICAVTPNLIEGK